MINLLTDYWSAISYALSWTIVDSLWQFLLIGLIIGVLLWKIPSQQSNLRYHIALASLILCAGLWLSNLSYHFTAFQGQTDSTAIENDLIQKEKTNSRISKRPVIIPEKQPLSESKSYSKNDRSSLKTILIQFVGNYKRELTILWLIGVVVLFLRLLGSWLFLKRLRTEQLQDVDNQFIERLSNLKQQLNIFKEIELSSSALVKTPMTFGYLKPIILLPLGLINQLEVAEVEAILLHELAHIKRNDFLVNVFQNCLNVLLFYHPVIWWLNKKINLLREECCDNLVIAQQLDKHLYANTLLQVHKYSLTVKNTLVMTATNKKSSLTQRIHRLFQPALPKRNQSFSIPLVIAFLLMGSLTLLAFQTIRQQPTVSVAADRMNILYYGVENPVTVAVEGVMNSELKVTSGAATITKLRDGKYNVFPNTTGEIKIIVEGNSLKQAVHFIVKPFPSPKVLSGNLSANASSLSLEEIKKMTKLSLERIEGFDETCEIVGFEVTRVPAPIIKEDIYTERTRTATFTDNDRIKVMLESAESGDTFYFDKINVKCPGDIESRDIGSFVIAVK